MVQGVDVGWGSYAAVTAASVLSVWAAGFVWPLVGGAAVMVPLAAVIGCAVRCGLGPGLVGTALAGPLTVSRYAMPCYVIAPAKLVPFTAFVAISVGVPFLFRRRIRVAGIRAEEARARAEEAVSFLEAAFVRAPVGISFLDRALCWVRVNEVMANIDGVSVAAHLGRTPADVLPTVGAKIVPFLTRVLATGKSVVDVEIVGDTPAAPGEPRFLACDFYPIKGRVGSAIGVGAVVKDVTAHRRADERASFLAEASLALSESIDYEATLARIASLAVPRVADWCIIDLADEAGELRHAVVAHADPDKQRWAQSLKERYPPRASQTSGPVNVIRTGRAELVPVVPEEAIRAVAHDSSHLAILRGLGVRSFMCVPLVAAGHAVGAIGFVAAESGRRYGEVDLAVAEELGRSASLALENARLYREAKAAVCQREELISIASHELKTPLATLQLCLQGVVGTFRAAPEKVESVTLAALASAERQTERLARHLNNLLDVSRIGAGKLVLERTELDLAGLVRDLAQRFNCEAARAGCELVVDALTEVTGCWDRLRIEQVVTNLLSNAIKYAPGRPIEVTITADIGVARVVVTDHGEGIAPEKLASVFERFERAGTSAAVAGLGLGLYIARQLVTAHGGQLSVASAVGAGSSFTVELPRRV